MIKSRCRFLQYISIIEMLSRINYTQKNKWLLPIFLFGVLLCWFAAFDQTYKAITLNSKLKNEANKANDLSFNPMYLKRKQAELDLILKGYEVDESWKDRLWIKSSSIAAKANVGVEYAISEAIDKTDSTSIGRLQSLSFYGGFLQLIRLTDSLERVKGIGRISSLQISAPKPDVVSVKSRQLELKVDFKGL